MFLPSLHHRSVLRKRPVQILFGFITLVIFFLIVEPPPSSTSSIPFFASSNLAYLKESEFDDYHKYDAALVVASRKKDDTAWLLNLSDTWRKCIYVTDDPQASLSVPVNKGREAMVYLTYIIDHYDILSNVTIFVHAERFQWHNDDPDYDGLRMLSRLNTSQIQSQGYASLRCAWSLGCPSEIHPFTDQGKTSWPPRAGQVYKSAFEQLFPGTQVPQVVGSACCAQFAVSRDVIRQRPKAEYQRYRDWIIDTEFVDDLSGRVLEYAWHIVFGKDAVYCPSAERCYCQLYGLCDLKCKDRNACQGRYVLPPFSTLPEGWPTIGWDGEARELHDE